MLQLLFLVLLFAFLGTIIGIITGLTPGLHVNTVALLLITSYSALIGAISALGGVPFYYLPPLVAVVIVSTSITHTFLDFVPSTFLGVPEDETALSVLPAHRLLLEGKGYHAVRLSALGSAMAVAIAFIIFLPYTYLLGDPLNLYPIIKDNTLFILLFLTSLLLVTETAKFRNSRVLGVLVALCVFILSGILGLVVLPLPSFSPFGLFSTVLFPLFSGLFGISTLLLSLNEFQEGNIPAQEVGKEEMDLRELRPAIPGGLAGSIVGFLPGVSSAHAALIALIPGRKGDDSSPESVIITLGAVNTSNAIFVLVALFLTGGARSGAAVAVQEFLPVDQWTGLIPYFLVLLLIAVLFSSVLAYFATLAAGKMAAKHINRIPYKKLVWSIIIFIVGLVFLFNGPLGLCILAVSTLAGMIPPLVGVRRSHLMGVLLIPVMLYLW